MYSHQNLLNFNDMLKFRDNFSQYHNVLANVYYCFNLRL